MLFDQLYVVLLKQSLVYGNNSFLAKSISPTPSILEAIIGVPFHEILNV